jgi:hypothetical protein
LALRAIVELLVPAPVVVPLVLAVVSVLVPEPVVVLAVVSVLVPEPVVVPPVLAVVSVLVPEPVVVPPVLAVVSVLVPEPVVVPLVLAVVSVLVPEPVVPLVLAVVSVLVPEPVVSLVLAVVSVLVPVVDAAVLGVHVTPVPLSIVPVVDCAYAGAIASAAKATVERRSFLMFRSSGFEFCLQGRIRRKARYSATVGATSLTRRCSSYFFAFGQAQGRRQVKAGLRAPILPRNNSHS